MLILACSLQTAGKTCITLACIDSNAGDASTMPDCPGRINTKATLVIVPGHLQGQWPKEIVKFCNSKRVVIIQNMNAFNKLKVSEILEADIIVVNFTVLCNVSIPTL